MGLRKLSTPTGQQAAGNTGHVVFDNGTTAIVFAAAGSTIAGDLTVTSGNASGITDSGAVSVAGNAIFTTDANAGVINLDLLQVDGTIRLDTHSTGTATIVNDNGVDLAANTGVGGATTITATAGDITASGIFTVSAGGASFITLGDNDDIDLDQIAVTGNITLTTTSTAANTANATITYSIPLSASNPIRGTPPSGHPAQPRRHSATRPTRSNNSP